MTQETGTDRRTADMSGAKFPNCRRSQSSLYFGDRGTLHSAHADSPLLHVTLMGFGDEWMHIETFPDFHA